MISLTPLSRMHRIVLVLIACVLLAPLAMYADVAPSGPEAPVAFTVSSNLPGTTHRAPVPPQAVIVLKSHQYGDGPDLTEVRGLLKRGWTIVSVTTSGTDACFTYVFVLNPAAP